MIDWVKLALWFVRGSWKTTVIGFLSAVCIMIIPSLQAGEMPTTPQWILALALAFMGTVAKDGDKSGTGQPGDPVRGTAGEPSLEQILVIPEADIPPEVQPIDKNWPPDHGAR
jgi:hypothetical protein